MPPLDGPNAGPANGALDSDGLGDHDQPYRFGFRPRASAPYPFNTRQYARLLVLRSRVHDHLGASLELVSCHDSNWRATRGVCGESEDG
jgi:hypothetical protein